VRARVRARARVRVTVAFLIFRDAPFLELAHLRVSTGLPSLLGHLSLAIRLGHRHIRRDGFESSALGARLVGGELGSKRRDELACAHNRTGSLRIGCILTLEVGLPEAAHRMSAATAAWRGQP